MPYKAYTNIRIYNYIGLYREMELFHYVVMDLYIHAFIALNKAVYKRFSYYWIEYPYFIECL